MAVFFVVAAAAAAAAADDDDDDDIVDNGAALTVAVCTFQMLVCVRTCAACCGLPKIAHIALMMPAEG